MIEVGDPLPDLGIDVFDPNGVLAAGGAVSVAIYADRRGGTVLASGGAVSVGGTALVVSNPSTGKYTSAYTPLVSGTLVVVWTVTGANAGVNVSTYTVEDPDFGIVSLAEVKAALKISRADTDDRLKAAILAASDLCEGPEGTGLTWRRTLVTNELQSGGVSSFQLSRNPVISITSVTVDGTAVAATDYDLNPATGRMFAVGGEWGWSGRRFNIAVSYVAGRAGPTPAGVREGTIEMVRHLMAASRGGSGIPRQEEPDYTAGTSGYLIPNRVVTAWRAASGVGL